MKVLAKLDPTSLRCPRPTGFCFKVATAGKGGGRVIQYRLYNGNLIGFLGPECRLVYVRKKAHVFRGGRAATDLAAQKCVLYTRNPGGKDPAVIYKKADLKK